MSADGWTEQSNRYLAASLNWLRLRLQRLAPEEPRPAIVTPASEAGFWQRWRTETPATKVQLLSEGVRPSIDQQIKDAEEERQSASKIEPPPALLLAAQRFGLSPFERDTLLLCAASELDPGLNALCGRVQGGRSYPTFALALMAFDDPSWDALSAHRPLRYARLIETQPGATSLTSSPLRADERIVNFLKGLNVLDDRVATLVRLVSSDRPAPIAPSQRKIADDILQRLRQSAEDSVLPIVELLGADAGSKFVVAGRVAAALNRRLYQLGVDALPSQVTEVETLARLWQRESFLLPVALYLDAESSDGPANETATAIQRFLAREVGLVFLGVRETPARLSCAHFLADVNKPTAAEQRQAWSDALGAEAKESGVARTLAGQFDLNIQDIQSAAASASKANADNDPERSLWDACRDLTRPRLDLLAQRLDPKATWDDLVLADEPLNLLKRIAGQVRDRHKVYDEWGFAAKMNRGFGISALFAGESGTGKTMAAEVIANDLRLNLYRIDLSAVVSKYIGETEKNLRKLFDAAEEGGAILFFDEADALFGKRSEVKDSHDRYANIEINYLLQRMEAYQRPGDPCDEHEERARSGVHAAAAVHREFPVSRDQRAAADLGKGAAAGDAESPAGFRPPRTAEPYRRQHSQHRSQRRIPGRTKRPDSDDADSAGRDAHGDAEAGKAIQRDGPAMKNEVPKGSFALHIERLVVDGVPLTPVQGMQFQRALERELVRLIEGGSDCRAGGAVPALVSPAIQIPTPVHPAGLGREVAQRVFESLQANP